MSRRKCDAEQHYGSQNVGAPSSSHGGIWECVLGAYLLDKGAVPADLCACGEGFKEAFPKRTTRTS